MDDRAILQARVHSLETALFKITQPNVWTTLTHTYIRGEINKLLAYEPSDLFAPIVPRGKDRRRVDDSIGGDPND